MAGLSKQLEKRELQRNVLLNIPIWGWEGDGKTCGLLTAIHFCDSLQHSFGFWFITNPDELEKLESSKDEYRGLNLPGIAAATTARLRALTEMFIDRNEWPPGSDEASAYILAIRRIDTTLGYAIFHDIQGGSFRQIDEIARTVINNAHAAIMFINPEKYTAKSSEGKRYKNEVVACLQDFGDAGVPICVMVTKADLYPNPNQAADETHADLTVVIERQKNVRASIYRVSVVGMDVEIKDGKLPNVADRKPEKLIEAWVWIVSQALLRSSEDVQKRAPLVGIRTGGNKAGNFALTPIALAALSATAAVVGADLKLIASTWTGEGISKTNVENSPTLHSSPIGMCWSDLAEILVVTFGDSTWRAFRPFGLLG
jgi:hypothetical protein